MRNTDAVPAQAQCRTRTPFTVDRDHQQPLKMLGEEVAVLASGADTGSYEVFLQAGPEGTGGSAPHTHPWDESFYVIAGAVNFCINDHEQTAQPGTLVHLPAGTKHCFRFAEGGGELLSITSREAASHVFIDIAREVSPTEPDVAKLVEVCARYGLEILGPPA